MASLARVMGSKYDRYASEPLLQRKVLLSHPAPLIPLQLLPLLPGISSKVSWLMYYFQNGALDLIATGIFQETSILPHLLVSSVDPHHTVVRKAEDALKKLNRPDMENRKLVDQLFALFAGTSKITTIPPEQRTRPVSIKVILLFSFFV